MTIPTGPFPAPIDIADILPGMHVRFTTTTEDGVSTLVGTCSVASIDASAITSTGGSQTGAAGVLPFSFLASQGTTTWELLEAFSGDITEPGVGSVVRSADGVVYQRSPVPANPTSSVWHPMGSTTVVNWATITAPGAPTLLLDGSTQ